MSEPTKVKVRCPNAECGKQLIITHPGKACTLQFSCPACGRKFRIGFTVNGASKAPDTDSLPAQNSAAAAPAGIPLGVARKPAPEIKKTVRSDGFDPRWSIAPSGSSAAVLRIKMHRRLLPATEKSFSLDGIGAWTIGRRDDVTPSDIQITGDCSISRRCATIIAQPGQMSTTYMLKVLKSKNPIFINQRPMTDSECIQLSDGDQIVMGQTSMTFQLK